VIYHDFLLDCAAISSTPTCIRSLKLSEIKTIDCGSTIDPDFPRQKQIPGTQIPTLDELFSMIDQIDHPHAKKVRLNLEVKRDPRHPELTLSAKELALKIVSKVKNKSFSKRVYYSSFDPEVLMEIHQLDPQAELGLIFDSTSFSMLEQLNPKNPMEALIQLAHSFKAKIVSPEEVLLDASLVHLLQQSGFHVVPWTVNSPKRWAELIEMGVNGLITDYPHDLLAFLDKRVGG
jgi:glycerophosphoryl diester phosphodiesterase